MSKGMDWDKTNWENKARKRGLSKVERLANQKAFDEYTEKLSQQQRKAEDHARWLKQKKNRAANGHKKPHWQDKPSRHSIVLECSSCPNTLDTQLNQWQPAWGMAKEQGWRARFTKADDLWIRYCPRCAMNGLTKQ